MKPRKDMWMGGRKGGAKRNKLLAALDKTKGVFLGYDKIRWDDSDLTSDEQQLKQA